MPRLLRVKKFKVATNEEELNSRSSDTAVLNTAQCLEDRRLQENKQEWNSQHIDIQKKRSRTIVRKGPDFVEEFDSEEIDQDDADDEEQPESVVEWLKLVPLPKRQNTSQPLEQESENDSEEEKLSSDEKFAEDKQRNVVESEKIKQYFNEIDQYKLEEEYV